MSYEEDSVRWQDTSSRLLNLRKADNDEFFTNINVILDELNSLDFSSQVVSEHEEALQVLAKCCVLIPGNGTNDLLATKLCHLIVNLISRQKAALNQTICNCVLEFLTGSIQCCQKWAFINHLQALDAVVYENSALCTKFASKLLAPSPEGLLAGLINGMGWDIEVRIKAVICVGNICNKGPSGSCIEDEYVYLAFEIILDTIRLTPCEKMDEISHYRLVLSALKALQMIQTILPNLRKDYEQPVLAALKNCMFCGLPGYHPKFIERSNSDQLAGSCEIHLDDLSSINLDAVPTKSRAYQNAIALNNKKKKKRNIKSKSHSQQSSSYAPPKLGPKIRRDYSSVDALMPAFARTNISVPQKAPTTGVPSTLKKDNYENSVNGDTPNRTLNQSEEHDSGSASDTSGSEAIVSATSSDSDYSDSEAGQLARLRSVALKVRQNALTCLQFAVKGLDKKTLFGYWSSFIPDSTSGSAWSLFTTILRDPSPKARAGGIAVLAELLDHSRPFLAAAEDRDEKSAVLSSRPFTSFSGRLGATVHEIHRNLLQALLAETSASTKLHMMKCLSVLILNSPYNRLREGLITRIVQQVKPLLLSKDINIRVTALTCLGMVISVHAPLNEVITLMMKPQHVNEEKQPTLANSHVDKKPPCDGVPEQTYPWLIETCIDMASRKPGKDVQPLVVRIEAFQVLIAFVRNYFDILSPCIDCITKLSSACTEDDQGLAVFAIKLLQELGRIMYSCLPGQTENKETNIKISKKQLLDFWMGLLNGPLISILQGSNIKLTTCAIDCLTNIGAQIFEMLPKDRKIFFITMLLGFSNDEDKNLKASAVRAVGVLVLYPCLREDVLYVADTANAVLICMEDPTLAVRMRAAWSLGNLSNTLVANKSFKATSFINDFSDMLLLKLLELSIAASEDHEKVKSNGVRAVGNILSYLKPSTLEKPRFSRCIDKAVHVLISNVGTGLMKIRWNACYAIGNMFSNTALPIGTASWTGDVFDALTRVIQDCKNFKVRINAVLSLSVPATRCCYGDVNQFVGIMEVLVQALESSRNLTEFSEFKYQENLQEQICNTLCHLVALTNETDLDLLHPVLNKNRGALGSLTDHMTSILFKESSEDGKDEDFEDNNDEIISTELSTRKTSRAEKTMQVQAACRHVFQELNGDHAAVQILKEVLIVREPLKPTVSPVKND